jgi:hypothetical protein
MRGHKLCLKKTIQDILIVILMLAGQQTIAQGPTSSIGDRENIGIYGGPAKDLSWSPLNNRVFAAVRTPATLFYSDNNCTNWQPAFPFDSLEYEFGARGWGGGAYSVLVNNLGWVLAHTGMPNGILSAAVVSYDNGNTFKTAIDPILIQNLVSTNKKVTAIGLSDHFVFVACENYLLRMNDTTAFGPEMVILNLELIPGLGPNSKILWISPSNNISGYPLFIVIENISGVKQLYKIYESILMELMVPLGGLDVVNVFTHPAQISGDTLFASYIDGTTQDVYLFRSLNGGFIWTNVTPASGVSNVLQDADYSEDWIAQMPLSNGLRLSFPGGPVSDNLGMSWQGPATVIMDYGIASNPDYPAIIAGSNNVGIAVSTGGIYGSFQKTDNVGFSSVNTNDIDANGGVFYVATDAGLAFTTEYYNPNISGFDLWIPPNGLFPVINAGSIEGVTSVCIDPSNFNHAICGSSNGFDVTFNGPNDFVHVTPSNWNNNPHLDPYVTDILFVNPTTLIAVTGFRYKSINSIPTNSIGNIWRSTDGGLTWSLVTPFTPNEFVMGNCLIKVMNGTQTILFCGTGYRINSTQFVPGVLWNSTNLGLNWIKVNDAPNPGNGGPLPILDIDSDPINGNIMYLSCGNALARTDNSGASFFICDVPDNTGSFNSALVIPTYPDSVYITVGKNLYKYSYILDDADLKFRGMPGESFISSAFGSILAGSNTGLSIISEAPTYDLELKVFIEGAFNGTEMNTALNTLGYLPLEQPFNQAPWFYDGTESVAFIPNSDIVDWVLVEIRLTQGDSSTATADKRFERKAGFLLKNGNIVDDDGITNLRFSVILATSKGSDKVHGVVYSPGHSGERTSSEMTSAKNSTFSYDFTTGANQAYGGASAHKEIAPGIWGMISGDGNQNGIIDNKDKNDFWLPQLGLYGYYLSDFNRDGQVSLTDKEDFWEPNSGTGNRIE